MTAIRVQHAARPGAPGDTTCFTRFDQLAHALGEHSMVRTTQPPAWRHHHGTGNPDIASFVLNLGGDAMRGILIGLALAGVGALGWWLLTGLETSPEVDPALERAVLPVIDEHLSRGPWRGSLPSHQGSAWFCSEDVVEIRREGGELKVGLDVWCQEYARSGDALLSGSGEHAPKLVTLTGGPSHYNVRRVESPRDGEAYWPSVERLFSPVGQAELRRRETRPIPELADPAIEARQAFDSRPPSRSSSRARAGDDDTLTEERRARP